MASKNIYNAINVVIIIFSAVYLVLYACEFYVNTDIKADVVITLLVTIILVDIIKGMRLYFELYEKHIPIGLYVRQYCKVMAVSMLLPFKLGDIFRAYCFGYQIGNYMVGIAVIILDRFVDTLALITIVLAFVLCLTFPMDILLYFFIFVLCILLVLYHILPEMLLYWKRYYVKQEATVHNIRVLRMLTRIQNTQKELSIIVHGKFLFVYVLSLMAWGAELGGLALTCRMMQWSFSEMASGYLSGVLFGDKQEYLSGFIVVSVFLLLVVYGFVAVKYRLGGKGFGKNICDF